MKRRLTAAVRALAVTLTIAAVVAIATPSAATTHPVPRLHSAVSAPQGLLDDIAGRSISWPVTPPRIVAGYRAPANPFAAGHRGIDLAARVGQQVRAPSEGVVAFVGRVVDRGVVTVDLGGGLVSTLEPVEALVEPGARVQEGDVIATVSTGGHTPAGALHFGVRWQGDYVNPLLLLGGVPRAVLLPCC